MSLPIFAPGSLDPIVDAYLADNAPNIALLCYFDFENSPAQLWPGEYDLNIGGLTWQGLGRSGAVVGIDGLELADTIDASQFNVTLSGVDSALMAIAGDTDRGDYVNQLFGLYLGFCDVNWQPMAEPVALAAGFMGTMTISRQKADNGWTRTISLPVNNIFTGRNIPPASFWTEADQEQRYPGQGDTGMKFIKQLQDYQVRQPWR